MEPIPSNQFERSDSNPEMSTAVDIPEEGIRSPTSVSSTSNIPASNMIASNTIASNILASNVIGTASMEDIPPPKPDFYAPPPYEVVTNPTKLPTYEEVQREKNLEQQDLTLTNPIPNIIHPSHYRTAGQRIVIETDRTAEEVDTTLLGTDFMFYMAFFVAFIFNWIGFLLLMCFCHTIASRYGALSGFGLSLAKWTFIVQHSTELASKDNSWLWWLIMTFGLIICIRAILQYLSIKRGWHMLSASHQERLLFFY